MYAPIVVLFNSHTSSTAVMRLRLLFTVRGGPCRLREFKVAVIYAYLPRVLYSVICVWHAV